MSWTLFLGLQVAAIVLVVATADILLTLLARLGYWPAWATPRDLADIGNDVWRPSYSGEFIAVHRDSLVLVVHRDQGPGPAHADLMQAAPGGPGLIESNHHLPTGRSLRDAAEAAVAWADAVLADPSHLDRYARPSPGADS